MASLSIGVAGGSGSGKTCVAQAIREALEGDAVLLDMDSYYRPLDHLTLAEREETNFDHPDALDIPLMIEQVNALRTGRGIDKPVYDFTRHTRFPDRVRVEPSDVIICEGILLFAFPELRRLFDIKVYVDVPDDIRFIRRLKRDVAKRGRTFESVIEQYLGTVRPMHLEFVEPSRRFADVIIPEGGRNKVGVEMVQARVLKARGERQEARG
jgi:uridine kinase